MIQLSPPELVNLNGCIQESVDSLTRVDAEKDLQKDIAERVKEEFELSPSEYKSLVMERYKDKCSEEIAKKESIVELNDEILTAVRNSKRSTSTEETSPVEEAISDAESRMQEE